MGEVKKRLKRAEVIRVLSQHKNDFVNRYGVTKLGIFGSVARDDAALASDVDVVVQLSKQDLFRIIGIKQDLEENLQVSVDVVSYRSGMDSYLKKCIDRDAVYV